MIPKLIIALYVLTTSGALVLIKLGSSNGAPVALSGAKLAFNLSLPIIAGAILYGISFLLYMFLISKHNLGYIIPLTTGLVYMAIFVASFFIFKESFTLIKIVGISLIAAGVIFLNVK